MTKINILNKDNIIIPDFFFFFFLPRAPIWLTTALSLCQILVFCSLCIFSIHFDVLACCIKMVFLSTPEGFTLFCLLPPEMPHQGGCPGPSGPYPGAYTLELGGTARPSQPPASPSPGSYFEQKGLQRLLGGLWPPLSPSPLSPGQGHSPPSASPHLPG